MRARQIEYGALFDELHIGDMDGAFALQNAAIRIVLALASVLLDDSHALGVPA